jgi:hypothetical protein
MSLKSNVKNSSFLTRHLNEIDNYFFKLKLTAEMRQCYECIIFKPSKPDGNGLFGKKLPNYPLKLPLQQIRLILLYKRLYM